ARDARVCGRLDAGSPGVARGPARRTRPRHGATAVAHLAVDDGHELDVRPGRLCSGPRAAPRPADQHRRPAARRRPQHRPAGAAAAFSIRGSLLVDGAICAGPANFQTWRRCGTSALRIWRKHMTHTTEADWSVAVFSSRESVSHLQKVVAACELACRERSAIIDVIVNGNALLAAEFRQSLVSPANPSSAATVRVWHVALGDKSHAWNTYIHEI